MNLETRLRHWFVVFWANNGKIAKIFTTIVFFLFLWIDQYGYGQFFASDIDTPMYVVIEREFNRLAGLIIAISLFNKLIK